MYVIGPWYYRVRVKKTRKELSYLSAMGAVTREGNFNIVEWWTVNGLSDKLIKVFFSICDIVKLWIVK